MFRWLIVASLIAITLLPTALGVTNAQANLLKEPTERSERWDFTIQTRYTGSETFDTNNGSTLALEDNLGWGFGFGYNFNPRFNLGFFFSWRSMHYTATAVSETDPTDTIDYSNVLDASTVAMSFTYYVLPTRLTPYLQGNLGWTLLDSNITAGYSTGCWYDPWYGYVCSSYPTSYGSDEFTYSLGIGLRCEVSPEVFIDVGYEHDWIDADTTEGFNMLRVDLGFTF